MATHLGDQRYDYIVCADVLEHLRDPERLVAQLPALLTPAGRLLLSIPNVSYAGLIGALINGDFQYRPEGLLDATHLRFFTRKSLLQWIEGCGMHATRIDTVTMPIDQSEFARDHLESLPPAVLRTLLALPDALTYQFIVDVEPAGSGTALIVDEPRATASFTFLAQLFYRSNQPFDEAQSCTVHGKLGAEQQRLSFPIPAPAADLQALRLDPTNRPGYLRLYAMSLFAAGGECVWRWNPSKPLDDVRTNQLRFAGSDDRSALIVIEGDDGWLELPVPRDALARLHDGGTLEVEASWPQSPDSHVVIEQLIGADGQRGVPELKRLNADMRAHIRTLSAEIKELQGQLRAARTTISQINQSLTFRLARPVNAVVNLLRRK